MTGYTNWNIEAFRKAEEWLSEQGHTVLNPAKHTPIVRPEDISHAQYMKIALDMLDCCDTIYMLKGWEKSLGARQEFQYALDQKKIVEFEA
jgi:hypothetical protein